MTCEEVRGLLGAYADRELGPTDDETVRRHLSWCGACRQEHEALTAVRETLAAQPRFEMPDRLRNRIDRALPKERVAWRWTVPVASFALGAACVAFLWVSLSLLKRDPGGLEAQLLAGHVRSLMPGHLIDVASSDRHTVRPWFAGKVDVAPAPWDMNALGFKLLGGRLDYIAGRPTAALVYSHGKHVINLFVLPASLADGLTSRDLQGFHMLAWTGGDLEYVALSDMDGAELRQFADNYRSQE